MKSTVTVQRTEVMNPDHPDWAEFVERMKNPSDSICMCERNQEYTKKVLESIPNIDVDESLEYLQSVGVSCDCDFFIDLLGMDPVGPKSRFISHEQQIIGSKIFCVVEDAFNWLGDRGYPKDWIKDYVLEVVAGEVSGFSE